MILFPAMTFAAHWVVANICILLHEVWECVPTGNRNDKLSFVNCGHRHVTPSNQQHGGCIFSFVFEQLQIIINVTFCIRASYLDIWTYQRCWQQTVKCPWIGVAQKHHDCWQDWVCCFSNSLLYNVTSKLQLLHKCSTRLLLFYRLIAVANSTIVDHWKKRNMFTS